VYQNYGFTPAWRECIAMVVSGGGLPWHAVCVDGANVIDRHSVDWRLRSSHHSRPHPATAPRTPLTTIVIHSRQVWNHHSDTQSRICGRWWARVRCVRAATMEQHSTRQECCTRRQSQARLRRKMSAAAAADLSAVSCSSGAWAGYCGWPVARQLSD